MFKNLADFLAKLAALFETTIPTARLQNDTVGRTWFLKGMGYDKTLKLEDLRTVCNTDDLNKLFTERIKVDDVKSRKGISAIKHEIGAMYSLKRGVVQRHKGRLAFYRDDLSQKGKRIPYTMGREQNLYNVFKKNLDN